MFIWSDLSTFDLPEAKRFYQACFGWEYHELSDGYLVCYAHGEPATGLYLMPEKFEAIRMPSFWMSYVGVDNLDAVVGLAREHGARIEVEPEPAPGGGHIALIRDPAGAGFTCYQGAALETNTTRARPGHRAWHELHVSNLDLVEGFYGSVFGWSTRRTGEESRYELVGPEGDVVCGLRVTPNELKGDKEYWGVYFLVADLGAAAARIERAGGTVVMREKVGEGTAALAYDSQNAAFYVLQL